MRDPTKVLTEQIEWLSPDGVIVACIPNVQHWSVILNLLAADGLRLKTESLIEIPSYVGSHKSIYDLFSEAGLQIHTLNREFLMLIRPKNW